MSTAGRSPVLLWMTSIESTARLLIFSPSLATLFHLGNALLFGLNRFFWIWLAAYPALLWFQQRVAL